MVLAANSSRISSDFAVRFGTVDRYGHTDTRDCCHVLVDKALREVTAETSQGEPMNRFRLRHPFLTWLSSLSLVGGALVVGVIHPVHPTLANGADPTCGFEPGVSETPQDGIFSGAVTDKLTGKAVGAARVVLVDATDSDLPYTTLGFSQTSCESSQGLFSMGPNSIPIPFSSSQPFHVGVVAPDGFASQWFPAGDRELADVFRMTDSGSFERQSGGVGPWVAVTLPITVPLERGNYFKWDVHKGSEGASFSNDEICATIWLVQPGSPGMTFAGSSCSFGSDIAIKGMAYESFYKISIYAGGGEPTFKTGFVKYLGTDSWEVVSDPSRATTLYSGTEGQEVSVGGASIGRVSKFVVPTGLQLSGRVVNVDTNAGLGDVCVNVYDSETALSGGDFIWQGADCTDANGDWAIPGLSSGGYLLYVGGGSNVIAGFYKQGSSAVADPFQSSVVQVTGNLAMPESFRVGLGNSVTGSITGLSGEYEICVNAFQEGALPGWQIWKGGTCTRTPNFEFSLPDGDYRFRYSDDYTNRTTTWLGGSSFATADRVSVSANVGLRDVSMSLGASLRGTVSLDGGGSSFSGICVSAFDGAGSDVNWGDWLGGTCLSDSGAFRISGIPNDATVKVYVDSRNGTHRPGFFRQGVDGNYSSTNSLATAISAGRSVVNITLPGGISFGGTVSDSDGNKLNGACLQALTEDWRWLSGSCSYEGEFRLSGLPSNSNVRVRVEAPQGNSGQRGGWLDFDGSSATLSDSSSVIQLSTSSISDVAVTLSAGVEIGGKFTVASGAVPTVCVSAFEVTTSAWLDRSCSNSSGDFTLRNLPPSTDVYAYIEPISKDYESDWYRVGDSPKVITTPSTGKTDVAPIQLVKLSDNSVTGRVTWIDTKPVVGALVMVKEAPVSATTSAVAWAITTTSGDFVLKGVPDGTFYVEVVDLEATTRFAAKKHDEQLTFPGASSPVVRNFSLEKASS